MLYLKIVTLTYSRHSTIVARWILKDTRNKEHVPYTRVWRGLMTEKTVAGIDATTHVDEDVTSWTERTVTVI